jgi:hypothetical protein
VGDDREAVLGEKRVKFVRVEARVVEGRILPYYHSDLGARAGDNSSAALFKRLQPFHAGAR